MINNYIKNITIDDNNKFITIYFMNSVYNDEGFYLNESNFILYLKVYNNYIDLPIKSVIKNDASSYTLFYALKKNQDIGYNPLIFVELDSVINYKNEKLDDIQNNNTVYIHYLNYELEKIYSKNTKKIYKQILTNDENTQDNDNNIEQENKINIPDNNINKTLEFNKVQKTNIPKCNYINRSSPMLAYIENKKNYYKSQIQNYPSFYGNRVSKYPQSYYRTTYNKIFKPS